MDDTFVIQEAKHSLQLLQHINSQDPHIQFAIEESNQEGALPFLDALVSPGLNNILVTTVYRKPTHTNQYLNWDSKHFMITKNIVFSTLAFRDKVICTSQQALHKEMEHMRKALQTCNFPPWVLKNLQFKFNHEHNTHNGQTTTSNHPNNINYNGANSKNISIVVPYIQTWGKVQKDMQQLGDPGELQRE